MKKVIFLIIAFNLALTSTVFGHSSMTTSPKNDEIVEHPLNIISLSFAKKTKVLKFKITNSTNEVISNNGELTKGFVTKFEAKVQDLEPDTYIVNWSAIGLDGHPVKNKFNFTVK